MKATKPTVSTTASIIVPSGGTGLTPRATVISVPTGGNTIYIGGSDVTAADGFPIIAASSLSLDVVQEPVYAIVAASTQAVNVLYREV